MATEARGAVAWNQPWDAERVAHNQAQSYSLRSMTLSVAGATAGVLGLKNLTGFAFFFVSVVFVNSVLLLVNAHGAPSRYFVLAMPPATTHPGEQLVPAKAAELRKKPAPAAVALNIARWVLFQGVQDNMLSYVLWWTFWYGIIHVYD
ncbi:hypothetical protein MSPP1_002877 [Malassezia sp. CBS 17886]|nr:hypothetical protein MSPP1_002877 [Malassezia sp. CBS 17886]